MRDPGVEANARLTAATGALIFFLLAAEGLTLLALRPLLGMHIFVGLVLVPPVLLKVGSTMYRFTRYYTGEPRYRRAGPPELVLRLLGPVMVVTTAVLLGSGIVIWLGEGYGLPWIEIHKLSFVVWFFATAIHVVGHLERTPALIWRDLVGADRVAGRITRGSVVAAALLLGIVLAVATLPVSSPFVFPVDAG